MLSTQSVYDMMTNIQFFSTILYPVFYHSLLRKKCKSLYRQIILLVLVKIEVIQKIICYLLRMEIIR